MDAFNTNQDELEIKEATVYFRVNEDKTYSTFKVVKFESQDIINSNEESKPIGETLTEQDAKTVLEEKYKNVENMWLDVTKFFNTGLGKEVKNFEKIVLNK